MLDLMRECRIDPDVVGELIDGVASDLAHAPFLDQAMLLRYCYRVAGTVGLMMCRVLDVSDRAANYYAIDLGIGMQLTNICRDVSEDAAANRRYIPTSLIGDITPQQLVDPVPELQPLIAQSVKHLLELADCYYESGGAGLAYLPLQARMGICVAGEVYQAIGVCLHRRNYACWNGRVRVNSFAKLAITLRSLANLLVRPVFWQLPQEHNHLLHMALHGLPYTDIRG
jgi:phytoene synthase